jgi:protein involved in polysaccharide export with SLBB domain
MHSKFYALAFVALFSASVPSQGQTVARAVPVDQAAPMEQLPPTAPSAQAERTAETSRGTQAPQAAQSSSANPNMVPLRSSDSIEIRIAGVPPDDIQQWDSLTYTVDESGNVNLPYISLMKAAGLSPSQLQIAIQNKLISDGIYTNPTITVNLPTGVRFVTVGGAVRAPGRVQYFSDLTLMSSISAAAGPSDYAGDTIRLIRGGKVQKYSRKKLSKDPSQDPRVNPGDQVELVESWY